MAMETAMGTAGASVCVTESVSAPVLELGWHSASVWV